MTNRFNRHLMATLGGNSNAFNEVVRQFREGAIAQAYVKLRNHFLAEEVAQEAFLSAFLNLPSLRDLNCFPRWFRSILISCISRAIRQNDLNIPFTDLDGIPDIPDNSQSEIEGIDRLETMRRFRKAMLRLGPLNKHICDCYYLQGLSHKEIGSMLDLPTGTVKRRLHDARKQICELLSCEENSRKIRVGYLPISDHLLAMVSHRFRDSGQIRIELQRFLSWSSLLNAICEGTLDAAFVMATMAFNLKNRGVPITYVLDAGYGGSALTVRDSIPSANALTGIRIGLPAANSTQHMLLKLFLANEGIPCERGVSAAYFSPSYSIGAFRNRLIDGFFCAEPWGSKAVHEGIGRTLVRSDQIMPGHICCIVAANNSFAKSQGEVLHHYIRKLLASRDFIRRDPALCSRIQSYYTGIDPAIAEHVIKSGFISYSDLIPDRERTAKTMEMAVAFGILDRPCNLDEFISTAFL
jgi:NitT/TauT family transport system substrate-binding protein